MKSKQIPYLDQLLELGKLYKIDELKLYAKSKKKLTTSQIELILLKNKIRLPEQSYNKKKIAEIACRIEINILNKPIGMQDQYIAAYGGLNWINFKFFFMIFT